MINFQTPDNFFAEAKSFIPLFRFNINEKLAFARMGERNGRQKGSSIDFQEHRSYFPGDDIRFIDWSASARTDQLMLKTFHEEISPILEICLDCSPSMAITTDKWYRTIQLLSFLIELTKSDHCLAKVYLFNTNPQRMHEIHENHLRQLVPSGNGLECVLKSPIPLQSNAIRIVISDFMIGENLNSVIHTIFRECSLGIGIRVLDLFEIEPTPVGGFRLVDSETGEQLSLRITKEICDKYKSRYAVHSKRIMDLLNRFNGKLVTYGTNQTLKEAIMLIQQQTGLIGFR